ncbi:hypothetical protein H9649_10840 [Sporosarcina sp. Sa2YVA2]|uniref:Uncharacterized protein n=1 Tax=Sporosarcina quadrami TaxID=2762234 RepID=A0ABR8UBH5_9BACL|nr:hypothetical protein [Sporosarcina quadrami]MBD7985084.1 hypothetical protein [Sporosarcina quadrami]
MGYILPIHSVTSEMYANRINQVENRFAYINRVQKVDMDPESMERFKDSLREERQHQMEERHMMTENPRPPYLKGFIYPNPVNLSPEISNVVGKGLAVNEYA